MANIPTTLKPAPDRVILITMPNYWGKGATVAAAKAALREAGGVPGEYWRVHSVHPDTYVDGCMGGISHPTDEPPVMLAESNPGG